MYKPHFKAFTGADASLKAERVGHWFKALAGYESSKEFCILRDIKLKVAEVPNSIGGFLAPHDFDSAVITVRESYGAFRAGADVRSTVSGSQFRPRRAGGVTANFVAEGQPIPELSALWDAVETSPKGMKILIRSSSELFEDEAASLGDWLAGEFGYALAGIEDDTGFNGDGTSAYMRISGLAAKLTGTASAVAAATGHSTFLSIDTTDLANLMGGVLATAIPGAAWYTGALGYAQIFCRLAATAGGLIATRRPDGMVDANFLGFPVRFSGKLPNSTSSLTGKPMLFFGNLRQSSTIVERNPEIVIAVSRERSLDTDQILVRGVQREDIVNHMAGLDQNSKATVAMLVGG